MRIPILTTGLLLASTAVLAQTPYPAKPVRIIVPSAPGGGTDITTRLLNLRFTEYFGQPFVVENRGGAATMIGTEMAARGAPDGYTLLMASSALTVNPAMVRKMAYDATRDFAPVSLVNVSPNVLVTHPSLPARSVREFIALARARPGQITYASSGVGSSLHLTMEYFMAESGIRMNHIPYKGSGPANIDVIAGHAVSLMGSMISVAPFIRDGRMRALGVTSLKRSPIVPAVPTIAESGVPGYESIQWYGLLAPAGTPRDIVMKLNEAVVRAVREPAIRKRFAEDGVDPAGSTPEAFAAVIRDDIAKWHRVVKQAGIKPE
jgi:tripartite-type tricarboxylate transporter receptor subunit TctC